MDVGQRRFLDAVKGCRSVALDTSACIYYLEAREPLASLLAPVIRRAAGGGLRIVLSAVVQLELLVGAYKSGDRTAVRRIIQFTERHAGVATYPITRDVVMATAQIRAILGLKTPDALIVGSASIWGAEAVIGNDGDFGRLRQAADIEVLVGSRRRALPSFLRLDDYA